MTGKCKERAFCALLLFLLNVADGQIYIGKQASETERPKFLAAILVKYQHRSTNLTYTGACGGTILNKFWVLTAAHCLEPNIIEYNGISMARYDIPDTVEVLLGHVHMNHAKQKMLARHWVLHHKYEEVEEANLLYDLALIKTDTEIEFNKRVKPATLPDLSERLKRNQECVVFGWGEQRKNKGSYTIQLKRGDFMYIKNTTLSKKSKRLGHLIDIGKRLNNSKTTSTTKGDSGGPFICDGVVHAVISTGESDWGVLRKGKPESGRATEILPNIGWIEEVFMLRTPHLTVNQNTNVPNPPFVVLLFNKYAGIRQAKLKCHGAVLSPNWIITAAHCLDDFEENRLERVSAVFGNDGELISNLPTQIWSASIRQDSNYWLTDPEYRKSNDELYENNFGLIYFRSLTYTDSFARFTMDKIPINPKNLKISYWQFDGDEFEVERLFSEKLMTVKATGKSVPASMRNLKNQLISVKVDGRFTPGQGILHDGRRFLGVSYRSHNGFRVAKEFSKVTRNTADWVRRCIVNAQYINGLQRLDKLCKIVETKRKNEDQGGNSNAKRPRRIVNRNGRNENSVDFC